MVFPSTMSAEEFTNRGYARTPKPSISSGGNLSYLLEESIPRKSPNPHELAANILKPTVPEVSLLDPDQGFLETVRKLKSSNNNQRLENPFQHEVLPRYYNPVRYMDCAHDVSPNLSNSDHEAKFKVMQDGINELLSIQNNYLIEEEREEEIEGSSSSDCGQNSYQCGSFIDDSLLQNLKSISVSEMPVSPQSSVRVDMVDFHDTFLSSKSIYSDKQSNSPVLGESISTCEANALPASLKHSLSNVNDILHNQISTGSDESHHQQEFVQKTLTNQLDICSNSIFDSFSLPKVNYPPMYLDYDSPTIDHSMQINKMAMKYLPDQYLDELSNNLRDEQVRSPPKDGHLLRKVLMDNQFGTRQTKPSEKTMYGIPCMSFASKKYLQSHGLLSDGYDADKEYPNHFDHVPEKENNPVWNQGQISTTPQKDPAKNSNFERILDITALKMQPKLM